MGDKTSLPPVTIVQFKKGEKMGAYLMLIYAALPLLSGLVLIKKTDDVYKAMLYSSFLGLMLYSVKIFTKALFAERGSCSVPILGRMACDSSMQAVTEGFRLMKDIVISKISIAAAVFVLFLMVKLICNSCALDYINQAADRFVKSSGRFLAVFLGISLLFSIDDYLCCVGVGAVTAGIAARHGLSREKTAYVICLLSLAFCTMVPYSSWMPVIRSVIGTAVPAGPVFLMNLAALFGIFIVMAEVLSVQTPPTSKQRPAATLPSDALKVFGLLTFSAAATAAVLITVNLTTDGSWSVAAAGTAGCIVLITCGISLGIVKPDILFPGLHDAFTDTVSLFKMLFFVWMVKDICIELLGLSGYLITAMESAGFPPYLIPGIVYLVSSGVAFLTGTSFGTFSLFIPLAVELLGNADNTLKAAAAAAALAGSLQSVNRPGSDVIRLTSGILHCDKKKLMAVQKQGALFEIPVLFIGFSAAGLCSDHGLTFMLFAGSVPLIISTMVYYLYLKKAGAEDRTVPVHSAFRGVPYKRKYFTFYQKCRDFEMLYTVILLRIRQKALALYPVNFI